jgi:hypothetical protein
MIIYNFENIEHLSAKAVARLASAMARTLSEIKPLEYSEERAASMPR